jgi:hypothetical protein
MTRGWIVCGWITAMIASALPVLWVVAERIEENPLGKYVDPATGAWTWVVYSRFFQWWLPVAVPVSLLALACLFLNRPSSRP